MQQHTALEQWKSCLPIRTALDQFDFLVKPLDHAIAPRFGAGISHRHFIVGQSIHKAYEFCDAA